MFKKDMCLQFRHNGKLICGKVKNSAMFIDSGKEKLGCDYAIVINQREGTIDGRPMERDYAVGDMDETRDLTDTYFIGSVVETSVGNRLHYKGTVVDFRLYPSKHHASELSLKDTEVNGKFIGEVCIKIIPLYGFYELVRAGQSRFTDAIISFARYHDVDVAKVQGRHLQLERVQVKGALKITCTDKKRATVELIDMLLDPGEPKKMFGEKPAEFCIPSNAKLKVVQKNITLRGRVKQPSPDLQWERDARKRQAYARTHK